MYLYLSGALPGCTHENALDRRSELLTKVIVFPSSIARGVSCLLLPRAYQGAAIWDELSTDEEDEDGMNEKSSKRRKEAHESSKHKKQKKKNKNKSKKRKKKGKGDLGE